MVPRLSASHGAFCKNVQYLAKQVQNKVKPGTQKQKGPQYVDVEERVNYRTCPKLLNKKTSFSLFNVTNKELQRVSYQIEVTSKLKSLSNYNIASDMLAFTRAPKELTRILKHSKGISIGIPREFVGIMKY